MGIEIAEKRGITPKEYRASIAGLDEMDFMAEVLGRTFLTLFEFLAYIKHIQFIGKHLDNCKTGAIICKKLGHNGLETFEL